MTFRQKLTYIAHKLGTRPEWLYAVMKHESNLNPHAKNSLGCVGLIQFCPDTAKDLGYDTEIIRQMNATDQLDLVYQYLKPYAGKLNSPVKVFLAVFYPYALKKINRSSYVLGSEKGLAYARKLKAQNPGYDVDKDGYITIKDVRKYVNRYLRKLKILRIAQIYALAGIISLIIIGVLAINKGYIEIEK